MTIWEQIATGLKKRKGEFTGTAGNEADIAKRVEKGKKVNIANPTSYRTYHNVGRGQLNENDVDIGLTSGKGAEIASTAISNAEYDPETGLAYMTFVGGEHPYEYKMTPDEWKKFISADSKGRFVAKEMNHNPHYRSPNY